MNTIVAFISASQTYYTTTDGRNWTTRVAGHFLKPDSAMHCAENTISNVMMIGVNAASRNVSVDDGLTWTQETGSTAVARLYVTKNIIMDVYLGGGSYLANAAIITGDANPPTGGSMVGFLNIGDGYAVTPSWFYTDDGKYLITTAGNAQYITETEVFKNANKADCVLVTQ